MDLCCPLCGYTWPYSGKMKYKVNCPDCRRSIKIEAAKILADAKKGIENGTNNTNTKPAAAPL